MSYKNFYSNPIRAIAISGQSGCGNTTVNQLVSDALNITSINYTMRSYAKEQGITLEEVARRAQEIPELDYLVDQKQIEMALRGPCVLSSRLAIWLLPKATLRVYLQASHAVRSARIARREGRVFEEISSKTLERDKQDHDRYQKLYDIDTHQFFFADLIINTETFDPYAVANMIVLAYRSLQQKPQS